jgi:hypothetical protein
MKHFLSSFALSFGLGLPLLVACSGEVADEPAAVDDVDAVDSEVKASKKKKQSCAAAGGACVGLSPSSCADGHWADAAKVTCGGGIGVGCCISCPVLSPPSPSFCPAGKIVPRQGANGCIGGYDCVPAPVPPPPPPPPPAPNACVAGGGTCVGLAPSSCPSGNWADYTTHSCGTGIGVGCCLP